MSPQGISFCEQVYYALIAREGEGLTKGDFQTMSVTYFTVKGAPSDRIGKAGVKPGAVAALEQITQASPLKKQGESPAAYSPLIARSAPIRQPKTISEAQPPRSKVTFFANTHAPDSADARRKASPAAASNRRYVSLAFLCILLIASGTYAALNRQMANMVTVPINVTRTGSVNSEPVQSPATASSSIIEEIPNMKPADIVLGSFAAYRQNTDASRAQALAALNEIIADPNTNESILADAQAQKLALANFMLIETDLEGLIAARGYGDSYVTARVGSVNIVVNNTNLSEAQRASIMEMAVSHTNEPPENIKISLAK